MPGLSQFTESLAFGWQEAFGSIPVVLLQFWWSDEGESLCNINLQCISLGIFENGSTD